MKRTFWKKTKLVTACVICSMILPAGCGREDKLPEEMKWSTETGAEDAQQLRLDQIEPGAYSSVDALQLDPGTKISMIMKSSGDDSYWSQVKAGAKQAEKELNDVMGYTGNDMIEVSVSGPTTAEDAEDQINLLDEEINAYPSAIIISLIDAGACEVQFDLASENGIPIVTMDSGSAYNGIATTCSTNNAAAAKKAAKEMSNMLGDSGQIVLVVHDSISETAETRENSFRNEINKNHPNIEIADTIHLDKMDMYKLAMSAEKAGLIEPIESAGKAEKINWAEEIGKDVSEEMIEDIEANEENEDAEEDGPDYEEDAEGISDEEVLHWMFEKHPGLNGIFTTNDNSASFLAEDKDNEEMIKDMVVVSFDAGEKQLQNLDNGLVDGFIVQNPYGMGYASVIAAARTILGAGNESEIDTGFQWVTKDNLSNTQIKAFLYE